ncbi:MAG: hypothetical protein H0X73_11800 [Chthoniobacterales bacterium]|nr:hypothetical protein [Chthoniobacterales bacterium]
MFPLYSATFPRTAAELESLLNQSVQRVFSRTTQPVTVREKEYPALAEIRISLDGAELRDDAPRRPAVEGVRKPALKVDELHVTGSGLTIGPATANLVLRAEQVGLNQAADRNGEIVLLLQNASNGTIEIATSKRDLERAIAAFAKAEAGKHGVVIDDVKLTFRQRGARSVDAEVQLRGKKLFFSTVIRIAASLDLDDDLNAKLSRLTCNGDGAIGSLACGVLAPHLQKLDGRTFALMALPLGEIRLRDVTLATGEMLKVSAEFGA